MLLPEATAFSGVASIFFQGRLNSLETKLESRLVTAEGIARNFLLRTRRNICVLYSRERSTSFIRTATLLSRLYRNRFQKKCLRMCRPARTREVHAEPFPPADRI